MPSCDQRLVGKAFTLPKICEGTADQGAEGSHRLVRVPTTMHRGLFAEDSNRKEGPLLANMFVASRLEVINVPAAKLSNGAEGKKSACFQSFVSALLLADTRLK